VCQTQVLHSYRNYDDNNKFEKIGSKGTHLLTLKQEIIIKGKTVQQQQ
jgi:hypothetical protein